MANNLRTVPAVHRLTSDPRIGAFADLLGSGITKRAIDVTLDRARSRLLADGGEAPSLDVLVAEIVARLTDEESHGLLPVLNGTGILLHTNLGRAPLAPQALAAMDAVAGGYSNLEFDLESGERGSRYARTGALLRETTGAEDSIVVNNCAAAVLLILDTFAKDREVIVSRNQLIEIGGGFRLPDVLRRSGATLVEVGATNKVYIADFARALTARTAILMRSHTSNYRIEGFTADVAPAELAALGKRAGVPTVEDLGSGTLVDLRAYGLPYERTVREVVAEGIDLVAFSGDKLLGGPQSGIIVGRTALIKRLRANPLLRALRVDKATLAALGATLRLALTPETMTQIPFYRMLATPLDALRARGEALRTRLAARDIRADVIESGGYTGGGALPLTTIPSIALALPMRDAGGVAKGLRAGRPPLVSRVADDRVMLDLRTLPPERDGDVAAAIERVLAR